ncbi:NirD/YgiW/YdeI family stress tolerance protein [Photobacterium sp. GJ3]|uniref:NirD/YgiW/YdeI family stress tolerance protein n=1 Tax=Photobacterium sp. GJ3 TaxID=2829502 RepID=UPI001B8BBC5F|nr:NirD/YgiW/YdeI family stress tolerance protein [Photobacterium sp. GJ3]QUJ67365.1 NirD/YgiW/YdeI family stress tolerance protein [Photobacterium sp. GJ3]
MNPILVLLISLALPLTAMAAQGGYTGPNETQNAPTTVAQAMQAADDSRVSLTGHIIASLGDEEYRFKDSTGEMIVEIDHHLWGDRQVGPDTEVTLMGEVDKDTHETTVDVKLIQISQ